MGAARTVASARQALARLRGFLLPGRSLAVFYGSLLFLLGLLSIGNFLSEAASHPIRLFNLVEHGSLAIVEIPGHYFVHAELFTKANGHFLTREPGALGFLALPAWGVVAVGHLVSAWLWLPAIFSALLYGFLRAEPRVAARLDSRGALAVAVGVLGVNLVLFRPIDLGLWDEMLAVQLTNATATALAAVAVYRILEARTGRRELGELGAVLFLVGPVAFWGAGVKDHALGVAGPAIAIAAFYGYHRTGETRYRLLSYAVLAVTVWGAGPYGLVALAAVGLVDLAKTLAHPRDSRAREVGLVLVLAVAAAAPYPVELEMATGGSGGPSVPEPPDSGDGTDGGGGDGGGPGGDGGDPGQDDGFDLRLPPPLDGLLSPILDQVGRLIGLWIAEPAAQLGHLVGSTWAGLADDDTIPLLVASPVLVAALALLLPRPKAPPLAAVVLQADPLSRVTVLEAALAAHAGLIVFTYVPWIGAVTRGADTLTSFDPRFLLPLALPLSIAAVLGLRDDLADRASRSLLLGAASFVALTGFLVAMLWATGFGDLRYLLEAVRLLGPIAAVALLGALVVDRWIRPGPLPYAVGLAIAVAGLWLFATTVVIKRGATPGGGGGYLLPLTDLLHALLA